jgi:glycosyltransferase involved in cell wall biosynthesis
MTEPASEVTLSVALVTRNRPEILRRCLKSWRSQTIAPLEIVVSDDSDQEHAGKVQDIAIQFGCRYLPGPRRGLYANRNHASLACQGTHILSADDDHTHPLDYLEKILSTIRADPGRVWVFSERHPSAPDEPLLCPPELHRSGHGCLPSDPSNCSSIADGSSVYPGTIFESGLRYDDTYRFGTMWYLWGRLLRKRGWRISFSEATFVWHHVTTEGREHDERFLRAQIECSTYVQFVAALWVDRSISRLAWAFAYLLRRLMFRDSITGYKVKTRLDLRAAVRLLTRSWNARIQYCK